MGFENESVLVAQTPELLSLTKEDAKIIMSRQAKKIMSKRVEKRFQSSDDVAKEYLTEKKKELQKRKQKVLLTELGTIQEKRGERQRLAQLKAKRWKKNWQECNKPKH